MTALNTAIQQFHRWLDTFLSLGLWPSKCMSTGLHRPNCALHSYDDLSTIRARHTKQAHRYIRERMSNENDIYHVKQNMRLHDWPTLMFNKRVYCKYHPKVRWSTKFESTVPIIIPFFKHSTLKKVEKEHIDHILPYYLIKNRCAYSQVVLLGLGQEFVWADKFKY